MKHFIQRTFRFFRNDQTGSMAVEAVLAVPMLFWAATATFTFYDAFKVQNASFRANYTISDMLSRQTEEIDQDYLDGLHQVFRYMTQSAVENSWIRVSVVGCYDECTDEENRVLEWEWSHGVNGAEDLDDDDLVLYRDRIPLMATGSKLILVETSRQYIPPFANALVSFVERDLISDVITRPRFAGQLCFDGSCNSGGGADEDDGPGGDL